MGTLFSDRASQSQNVEGNCEWETLSLVNADLHHIPSSVPANNSWLAYGQSRLVVALLVLGATLSLLWSATWLQLLPTPSLGGQQSDHRQPNSYHRERVSDLTVGARPTFDALFTDLVSPNWSAQMTSAQLQAMQMSAGGNIRECLHNGGEIMFPAALDQRLLWSWDGSTARDQVRLEITAGPCSRLQVNGTDSFQTLVDAVIEFTITFQIDLSLLAANLSSLDEPFVQGKPFFWLYSHSQFMTIGRPIAQNHDGLLRRALAGARTNNSFPVVEVSIPFQVQLKDPAKYQLYIAMRFQPGRGYKYIQIGSTYDIEARHSQYSGSPEQISTLPLLECAGWQAENAEAGRWVSCETLGRSRLTTCLRDGWVYVPSHCFYQIYDPERIANMPVWIVWLGTSIVRGNFLTLVDLMLSRRAGNLTVSDFWKCWNWMDLQLDVFRTSYLDWRWSVWDTLSDFLADRSRYEPAIEADYLKRAESMLRRMTSPQGLFSDGQQPDVVFVEVEQWFSLWHIDQINSWIDPKWKGRKLLGLSKFHVGREVNEWRLNHEQLLRYIAERSSAGWEVVSDAASFHTLQAAEMHGHAVHSHSQCNDNGKFVCGMANEMSFHMLMSTLLRRAPIGWSATARLSRFLSEKPATSTATRSDCALVAGSDPSTGKDRELRKMIFCLQCPRSLTPFSMPVTLNPVCYDHIPRELGRWNR